MKEFNMDDSIQIQFTDVNDSIFIWPDLDQTPPKHLTTVRFPWLLPVLVAVAMTIFLIISFANHHKRFLQQRRRSSQYLLVQRHRVAGPLFTQHSPGVEVKKVLTHQTTLRDKIRRCYSLSPRIFKTKKSSSEDKEEPGDNSVKKSVEGKSEERTQFTFVSNPEEDVKSLESSFNFTVKQDQSFAALVGKLRYATAPLASTENVDIESEKTSLNFQSVPRIKVGQHCSESEVNGKAKVDLRKVEAGDSSQVTGQLETPRQDHVIKNLPVPILHQSPSDDDVTSDFTGKSVNKNRLTFAGGKSPNKFSMHAYKAEVSSSCFNNKDDSDDKDVEVLTRPDDHPAEILRLRNDFRSSRPPLPATRRPNCDVIGSLIKIKTVTKQIQDLHSSEVGHASDALTSGKGHRKKTKPRDCEVCKATRRFLMELNDNDLNNINEFIE